jgi:hypothetical protein
MKKLYSPIFIAAFVLFFATAAQAATPTINGVSAKTKNSLKLQIQDTDFAKRKTHFEIYVDEVNVDEFYTLKFSKKLNGSGKYNAKIWGLDEGTTYRFSVRMRLHPQDSWSEWSDWYYTTTKGTPIW